MTSQNRAEAAIKAGFFEREILPVTLADGTVVSTDDGPRAGVTLEAVQALNPVFRENGTVTAGNCCPLNDGASGVVIMSDTKAKELGLTPLARIISTGVSGLPEIMGMGPVEACRQALARAGMSIRTSTLRDQRGLCVAGARPADDLGMDFDRLNVHGGAIASATLRLHRHAHHGHLDQRPADEGQAVRARVDVRRGRAGHGDPRRAPELRPCPVVRVGRGAGSPAPPVCRGLAPRGTPPTSTFGWCSAVAGPRSSTQARPVTSASRSSVSRIRGIPARA